MALVALAGVRPAVAQVPGAPTPAGGSSQTVEDIRDNYRIHVGPFYMNPALLLKELGVDTNVFNTAEDPKTDFTATVTPVADVAVPVARKALFKATVGADFVYFGTYASERSIDPQVRVRAEGYIHRVTLFAEDAYLNTRERPNYEIDLRSRHLENDAVAGVKLQATPKLSGEIGARSAETRYDADAYFNGTPLQQTLNRTTSGAVGAIHDRLTPLTSVGVKFDRLRDTFPYSPGRNSDSYRIMPGVEFKPKALIRGSAWVGYRSFTPDNPKELPAFSGLVADVGLSYTLLGSTTLGASYFRDLTYSYEVEQPFFVDNSAGVSIRRELGGRFDAIVTGDRHRYDYHSQLTAALPKADGRVDTTWVYGANVGYRLNSAARVGFGVSYYTRNSTLVNSVQYDGLRFGVTVNYGI